MSDFIKILTHERRLKASTKELSVSELEEVEKKLLNVIAARKKEEEEEKAEQRLKQEKIEEFKKAMADAGIGISDILENEIGGEPLKATKKKRAPKPPKYAFTDEQGERATWTGQGRMPKALKKALEQGHRLEEYLIK